MDNPWIKQESLQLYLRNQLRDHISLFCLGLPALPDAQSHGITRIYGLADDWAAWLEVLTAVTMCTKCHLGHPGPQSPASVGSALAVGQAGAGALHYSHFGAGTHCQSAALTLDLPMQNMQLKQHSGASNYKTS